MKKIGDAPESFAFYNTCQHNGRVFHFAGRNRKLVVTEVILGDRAQFVTVPTEIAVYPCLGCCSFGQDILVISIYADMSFAVLLRVGSGTLRPSAIFLASLTIIDDNEWHSSPCLVQVASNRVVLHFIGRNGIWYCDITGTVVIKRKCNVPMPAKGGFCTFLICLPSGKLLAAGSDAASKDITLITTGEEPSFEKAGSIPGKGRYWTTTILVNERFVIGFGGYNRRALDDLWIFDLQTRRSSEIRREGEWHSKDMWLPLVVQDETLYIVGGFYSMAVCALPLSTLPRLIQDPVISSDFSQTIH